MPVASVEKWRVDVGLMAAIVGCGRRQRSTEPEFTGAQSYTCTSKKKTCLLFLGLLLLLITAAAARLAVTTVCTQEILEAGTRQEKKCQLHAVSLQTVLSPQLMLALAVCTLAMISLFLIEMLLMVSGDVEPNPGPQTKLTPRDLPEIEKALYSVRHQWMNIGRCLGLMRVVILSITKHTDDPVACLRQVLEQWLHDTQKTCTWKVIVEALKDDTVRKTELAEEIRSRHCIISAQEEESNMERSELVYNYEEVPPPLPLPPTTSKAHNIQLPEMNYKAILNKYCQKHYLVIPEYKTKCHKNSTGYIAMVTVCGKEYRSTAHASKKKAEQKAAALAALDLGLVRASGREEGGGEGYRSPVSQSFTTGAALDIEKGAFSPQQVSGLRAVAQPYMYMPYFYGDHKKAFRGYGETVRRTTPQPENARYSSDPYNTAHHIPSWLRPVTTLTNCTSNGRKYYNGCNDFNLEIPEGAIPKGVRVTIDIGVALCGPFQHPEGLRRVSPVFWICVRGDKDLHFLKPVKITIEHCLSLDKDTDIHSLGLTFLKAGHTLNSAGNYELHSADGIQDFQSDLSHGTLTTDHFCFLCIEANEDHETAKKNGYFLIRAHLIPIRGIHEMEFFITLKLRCCVQAVMVRYEEDRNCNMYMLGIGQFYFNLEDNDGVLIFKYTCTEPEMWNIHLLSYEMISAKDVLSDKNQLKRMKLLPNIRFRLELVGTDVTNKGKVKFEFTGATKELVFEDLLPKERRYNYADQDVNMEQLAELRSTIARLKSESFSVRLGHQQRIEELTKTNEKLTSKIDMLQSMKHAQISALELPGVEILDRASFVIQPSTQPQSLNWDDFGFSVHVPANAVSIETALTVAVSTSGMFEFPVGTIPVSSVFYLHSSKPVCKPVILEMEHCCIIPQGSNVRLRFAKAVTDSKHPPYHFIWLRSGDVCVSTSYYGQVSVSSFSIFTELLDSLTGRSSSQVIEYFAHIQYKQDGPTTWKIVVVIAKKLRSFQQAIKKAYRIDQQWKKMVDFPVQFKESATEVEFCLLPCGGKSNDDKWIVNSFINPCVILKENVDNYKPKAHGLAKCELVARWLSKTEPPNDVFCYTLNLRGVKTESVNLMFEPGTTVKSEDFVSLTGSLHGRISESHIQLGAEETSSSFSPTTLPEAIPVSPTTPDVYKIDDAPKLPNLLNFKTKDGTTINISQRIGKYSKQFGISLLRDSTGDLVDGLIKSDGPDHATVNNIAIFQCWLQGTGSPRTWATLIRCLRECMLNTLADQIENTF